MFQEDQALQGKTVNMAKAERDQRVLEANLASTVSKVKLEVVDKKGPQGLKDLPVPLDNQDKQALQVNQELPANEGCQEQMLLIVLAQIDRPLFSTANRSLGEQTTFSTLIITV